MTFGRASSLSGKTEVKADRSRIIAYTGAIGPTDGLAISVASWLSEANILAHHAAIGTSLPYLVNHEQWQVATAICNTLTDSYPSSFTI